MTDAGYLGPADGSLQLVPHNLLHLGGLVTHQLYNLRLNLRRGFAHAVFQAHKGHRNLAAQRFQQCQFRFNDPVQSLQNKDGLTIEDDWVEMNPCRKHLGLYAYHAELLAKFATLPPGELEQIEKLEQLRVLENGYDIAVGLTDEPSIGIDTPKDAEKFEAALG